MAGPKLTQSFRLSNEEHVVLMIPYANVYTAGRRIMINGINNRLSWLCISGEGKKIIYWLASILVSENTELAVPMLCLHQNQLIIIQHPQNTATQLVYLSVKMKYVSRDYCEEVTETKFLFYIRYFCNSFSSSSYNIQRDKQLFLNNNKNYGW